MKIAVNQNNDFLCAELLLINIRILPGFVNYLGGFAAITVNMVVSFFPVLGFDFVFNKNKFSEA